MVSGHHIAASLLLCVCPFGLSEDSKTQVSMN